MVKFTDIPLKSRFSTKVDRRGPDDCWPWIGAVSSRGYGTIRMEGRTGKATHAAVLLSSGERVLPGMMVCHTCDNPLCVNPAHLWIGTKNENMRDAYNKGRLGHFIEGRNRRANMRRCASQKEGE